MVRSEDEIQRYDIFKVSVLVFLVAATGLAFAKRGPAPGLQKTEMALSMVEPTAQDAVLEEDTTRFSGLAPGKLVYLYSDRKKIGESKVVDYSWEMTVNTKDLVNVDVTLVAKDEDNKDLDSLGPMRFNIPEEVRKRLDKRSELVPELPVQITKPIDGEQLADATVAFFGTGVPDSSVKVFLKRLDLPSGLKSEGEQINKPTVDKSGEWQFVKTFSPGSYRVTALTSSHSSSVEFTVMKTTGGFTEN